MPLNIKNADVTRLANELARETGESITDAVGKAVEERLARVQRQRQGVYEKVMAIAHDFASRAPKEWLTWDYDADLYDEKGLPK